MQLTALPLKFGPGWVSTWLGRFARAWPIAFVLSVIVGPLAFRMVHGLMALIQRRSSLGAR